jgi:hypothetical protein
VAYINSINEVVINPLITLKVVGYNGRLNKFTQLYKYDGYIIEFHTHKINCADVSDYFNEVSLTYPQQLTTIIFKTKQELEKFINTWVEVNVDKLKEFEKKYKWLLN